jgi:hypothetical protein
MLYRAARGWAILLATGSLLFPASAGTHGPARTVALAQAPAPSGDAYPVKLTRPVRAGQRYQYTADATVVQSMTANVSGQTRTINPRSRSVRLEAVEHVVAVNALGEPTETVYAVEKCTVREGKKVRNVLQPGVNVTAEAGKWKPRLNVDRGTLTIQDELLLRAVIGLPSADNVSDDQCYGTDKPQKVGGEWPVRPEAVARSIAAAGVAVKKGDVSGTVRLRDVTTVDGVPCLRVQGRAVISHFLPPDNDLPREMRVTDSTVEYKFTKLVPVDPAGAILSDSYSMRVNLKLKTDMAKIGPNVAVDGKLLTTVGVRRTPIAPGQAPKAAAEE